MNISKLLAGFRNGTIKLEKYYQELCQKLENSPDEIWITKFSKEQIFESLKFLKGKDPKKLPLYGISFAIKDNIDFKGVKTTAGCPKYAYVPKENAYVVDLLIKNGAIAIGKTNMDQFATGLVGVRSPYGSVPNKYAKGYISGGSSSGSAASLAYGLCSFSLGTDTAGSGRVPACFNKLVGFKPSRGLLSTNGVVPACKSLDCISIFAHNAEDAQCVFELIAKYNPEDSYSVKLEEKSNFNNSKKTSFTFAIPRKKDLQFFGNTSYEKAFFEAIENLEKMGGQKQEINFSPFLDSAKLLYNGSWVYERYASVGNFIEENSEAVEDVIKKIILPKTNKTPQDVFKDFYTLQEFKAKANEIFKDFDFIITPTAGTCYKVEEVLKNPIELNSNLGYYTNFMNLLDFCAIAIPSKCEDDFPFGFTIVAKKFEDKSLFSLAKAYENFTTYKEICVCGAHLRGGKLHYQLEELSAEFVKCAKTAKEYKMYSIENNTKPCLIREFIDKNKSITKKTNVNSFYVEIYKLSLANYATFVSNIPSPLGIGKVLLENNEYISGFLGEYFSIKKSNAQDITKYGDWRRFREVNR